MPALVVAIGNTLRRDDGVAHYIRIPGRVEKKGVLQLTPEIAAEIAPYNPVIFVDAAVDATELRIEPVDSPPSGSPLTHASSPAEIVALARALFHFSGRAYTCRIPARDLSEGQGLSPATRKFAQRAGREVYKISQSHANRPSDTRPLLPGRGCAE
jgi:Ni,Fe-hydrogenase maturation factor